MASGAPSVALSVLWIQSKRAAAGPALTRVFHDGGDFAERARPDARRRNGRKRRKKEEELYVEEPEEKAVEEYPISNRRFPTSFISPLTRA